MPKTLLLADDSVVIQKLVGLSFANEDVKLVTTDNGDDAIAKALEVKPDVVLADVVMPGKNGYEVCEAIRREAGLKNTPVLLLTGTFEAFDEARARDVGSNGHITKPFEAQALVTRVNELFAQASAPDLASTAPSGAADEGFDFFDDGVTNLAGEPGMDLTATSPPRDASPARASAPAMDQGFDFGADSDLGDAASAPDLLDDSLGMGAPSAGGPAPDQTVALMPDDDLDDLIGEVGAAESASQQSPTLTHVPAETPANARASLDDLDIGDDDDAVDAAPIPADMNDAAGLTILDEAGFSTELAAQPRPAKPAPIPMNEPTGDASSATTIIMSDGETSSDGIQLGGINPPVTNLDELDDDLADLADLAASGSEDAMPSGRATPSPAETVLADDLFDTNPAAAEVPAAPKRGALDDSFDFGTSNAELDTEEAEVVAEPVAASSPAPLSALADTDPLAGSAPDLQRVPEAGRAPLADPSGYDVSSSDLGDPFDLPSAKPAAAETELEAEPIEDLDESADSAAADAGLSVSEGLLGGSSESQSGPDISPVMRDRIHETLERVAWEAFADLSETMVKTVLERVESIAWEVIPQMAEALVKEEIRRMKGEDED